MQKNPDVTLRSRGVMEKCTYCIQRTNAARIECKLQDLKGADGRTMIPDGFVQTACQQACPSDSIVFGDILDKASQYSNEDGSVRTGSKVHATRMSARSYLLLGYLNTRPRTSHLLKIRNPNPLLREPILDLHSAAAGHGEGAHGEEGHDGHDHGPGGHDEGTDGQGGHAEPKAGTQSFKFDRTRMQDDEGYALSLKVLTGRNG